MSRLVQFRPGVFARDGEEHTTRDGRVWEFGFVSGIAIAPPLASSFGWRLKADRKIKPPPELERRPLPKARKPLIRGQQLPEAPR